jgi:hypothetical protein
MVVVWKGRFKESKLEALEKSLKGFVVVLVSGELN